MEATLYVDGEITPYAADDDEFFFFGPATSLKAIRKQLEKAGAYNSVRVKINSVGGSVSEGFAIADYLTSLQVPVTTEGFGAVHSIASAIFLAGNTRIMGPNATMLIHLPSGGVYGTADEIEAYNTYIQGEKKRLIEFYVSRTGIDRTLVEDLMRKETNLTAEDCKSYGFANADMVTAKAKATFDGFANGPQASQKVTPSTPNMSLTQKAFTKVKELMALFGDAEPAGKTVKNLALNSDKGDLTVHTTLATELPAVGDQVDLNGEPAPSDAYVVSATGQTLTVQDGKITDIQIPETPSDEEMKKIEELEAKNAALTQEFEAVKNAQAAEATAAAAFRKDVTDKLKLITSAEPPAAGDHMENKGNASNKAEDTDDIVARNLAARKVARNQAKQ